MKPFRIIPLAATVAVLGLSACMHRPAVKPIVGVVQPALALPRYELPKEYRQGAFSWEFDDDGMYVRGDGAVRVAPPDSVRIDLFVGGGLGSASVLLVGDTVNIPRMPSVRSMLPPTTLLWAALGRLVLPALPDTVVRTSGDTVQAELGRPVVWRATGVGGQLIRLERLAEGGVVESVVRTPGKRARYESSGRRSLVLNITRDQLVPAFDASTWTIP